MAAVGQMPGLVAEGLALQALAVVVAVALVGIAAAAYGLAVFGREPEEVSEGRIEVAGKFAHRPAAAADIGLVALAEVVA